MADRTGLFLIGARGGIGVCTAVGLSALQRGLVGPVGLVSELPEFRALGLAPLDRFVLGGCDLRAVPLVAAAREFQTRTGLFAAGLLDGVRPDLRSIDRRIGPGLAVRPGPVLLRATGARPPRASTASSAARFRSQLRRFRRAHGLERVVVVNVASTEPPLAPDPAHATPEGIERLVRRGPARALSSGVVYAWAALQEGCAYVNFTPSPGTELPGLGTLAGRRGLPHMGKDGKTGETLVKTTLAPMFRDRNLKVLSWYGYNLLGNRDGLVLQNPDHGAGKLRSKDRALRSLLGPNGLRSKVQIDYVPSLDDWKTAWDFVHFQGFLGAKMSLQFTWQGCDSALAAPLVLDLARFADRALREGAAGPMTWLASFFKDPIGADEHGFGAQFEALRRYARSRRGPKARIKRR